MCVIRFIVKQAVLAPKEDIPPGLPEILRRGRLRGSRILLLPLVAGSNYHHGMLARTNIAEFLTRLPFDYRRVLVMARLLHQLIVMRLNLQCLLLRQLVASARYWTTPAPTNQARMPGKSDP